MKSNIEYDKKVAKRFHDTGYYESEGYHKTNLGFMEKEKLKHKTKNKIEVTEKINAILQSVGENSRVFHILENIYNKNQDYAFNKTNTKPINSDLLNLLADENLLITAYKKVRKNKGAMTKAYDMSENSYKTKNEQEKSWVNKTTNSPDGINREVFHQTSLMIKENRYPWGSSRRIYTDKPGNKKVKRPITIPPFMDKVVQEALQIILMSIYEPYFEVKNCSFGFRPNKGVHDAIVSLTSPGTKGSNYALEGDIKSAYDKVSKQKLIEILGNKIQDRKFLNFIKKRLNYEYFDTKEEKYFNPEIGLPQGGIDSPYLWNIYMSSFDEFITNSLNEFTYKMNLKVLGTLKKKEVVTSEKRKNGRLRATSEKIEDLIKSTKNDKEIIEKLEYIYLIPSEQIRREKIMTGELQGLKMILKTIGVGDLKDIKQIQKNFKNYLKGIEDRNIKLPTRDKNKLKLKFTYVRYADDWIIITNMKKDMLERWKEKIKIFLKTELQAELSDEKTLLTDIRINSAHFLGFEIFTYNTKKISSYKKVRKGKSKIIKAVVAGNRVFARPDRQRLITRLHMKGYCDKKGFPREIGFLTNLEDFTIIERYNSVLRGITNYYAEFIKNPKKDLSRWIYIIRYSCIKTLAQKHKIPITQIFKKYLAPKQKNAKCKENTIQVTVKNIIGNEVYSKTWRLLTREEVIKTSFELKIKRKRLDTYWKLKKGETVLYEATDKHAITNDNFCDKLMWVSIRTQASFDLPCSICGSLEDIEMHHINHVRKNKYNLIDKEKTWAQAMYLRNRKQIPVCKECHVNLIHKNNYGGTKFSYLSPKIMHDNRIITIEGHINREALHKNKANYSKTLLEKGWVKEQES